MAYSEILSSFIGNLFKGSEERIRFLSLTEGMMKQLPDVFPENVIKIDLINDYTPIKPFVELLSLNPPRPEVIDKTAYSLHRDVFKSYFENRMAKDRLDLVIEEEVFYERSRFRDTITNFFHYFFEGDVIVLNSQEMGQEAIDIIRNLEKTSFNGRIIFCFDSIKVEAAPKNVIDFFEEISTQKNFFDISNIKDTDSLKPSNDDLIEDLPDFDLLYNSFRNNRLFLSVDQNRHLADWVASRFDKFGYNTFQSRALQMESGIAYFYAEQNDSATLCFNSVLEAQYDDEMNILALIYLAKVMAEKNSNATALKYATLAKQKLASSKDSPLYALAMMMEYIITERSDNEDAVKKYKRVLELLKKNKLTNNYVKTLLVVPWYAVSSDRYRPEVLDNIEEAFTLANELDNKFVLSTACHWRGIILSYAGDPDEALDWYFKCNDLRTRIGDLLSMMKIRNGLSYEALSRAQYDDSYDLINSFINRIGEISDYAEILNTLKNVAHALFYARKFDESYLIFQKIIHFIHLFNLEDTTYDSFVPEYNDMLIYKTFIELGRGDLIRSKINFVNIMHNGRAISPIEQPLLALLQALISAEEGEIDDAIDFFESGMKMFAQVGKSQEHRLVFMYYEFSYHLSLLNRKELAEKYFKKGLEVAHQFNFAHYTKFKDDLTLEEYIEDKVVLEPLNVNLNYLEEKAEKDRLLNQLHASLHNYQFLNRIMAFASNSPNTKAFVHNAIQASFDYTMADAIFIFEQTENGWKNLSSSGGVSDLKEPDSDMMEAIAGENSEQKNGKLVWDEKLGAYRANLSKFEFKGGFIIYPNKTNPFSTETLNIMNIALSNIQAHLVMLKQNEHLMYISSTDQLSGLKNRRALQDFITLENERLRRYKTKRKFVLQETIAFIDLDNFKFYNDTFGHEAGDLFISCFAQLLKKIYRRVDFIARFGGDEFIVILSDASCSEAQRVAGRLYEGLSSEGFFIPKLEAMLGQKVLVSPEKYLNFSMGLCSNYDFEDTSDLDQVMTKADAALYYSKEHGKGKVTIWTDIKDSLSEDDKNSKKLDN